MKSVDFFDGGIVDSIGKIADNSTINNEEKVEKENEKLKTDLNYKLEMARFEHESLQNENNNITNRWTSDNSSSWLAKNVRPLTLIFLFIVLVVMAFTSGNIGNFKIANNFVDLFQILALTVFGAYFGGRSLEKIKKKDSH